MRSNIWYGCLILLGLGFCQKAMSMGESVDSEHWTDEYDHHFKKYTKRYFGPHFDWHWFKAQAIAESGLRSEVTSPRGAQGVMQILPSTYEEIKADNPYFKDISKPRWNIAAGIYYDRTLYRRWRSLNNPERLYTSFASYNAGFSRILRLYHRIKEPATQWPQIKSHLPKETRRYVSRIRRLKDDTVQQDSRLKGIAAYLTAAEPE